MATAKNEVMNSGRRVAASQGNYAVHVMVLLLALVAAIYGGNILAVDAASQYKEEVKDVKAKYDQSIAMSQQLEQKVQRVQSEMQSVQQKADLWKNSESKLNKPLTINAGEWLATRAREQQPSVSVDSTVTESAVPGKKDSVQMKVHGEFSSLLSWVMQAEHELDVIRIVDAEWRAKTPKIIELTLNIEVDSNE